MVWKIDYTEDARRTLRRLDPEVSERIVTFMERRVAVLDDPTQIAERLRGKLRDYWRYRVGDYRIICEIKKAAVTVVVVRVGHRRDVYR